HRCVARGAGTRFDGMGIQNDVTLCGVRSVMRWPHSQIGWQIRRTLAAQLRITICSAFNIHYPTDSTLLGDGVRVLTRTMKKITKIVGAIGTKLSDRSRSAKLRLVEIGRAARAKAPTTHDTSKQRHRTALTPTHRA